MRLSRKAAALLRFLNTLDGRSWNESKHRRDRKGQFAATGGGGAAPAEKTESTGGHKTTHEIRAYLSGNPQPNQREIDKHIEGTPAFRKYAHNRAGKGLPPQSHFRREDAAAVQAEVADALRNGKYKIQNRPGRESQVFVRLAKTRGIAYNDAGEPIETNLVRLSISLKKGYHYYPQWKEE